MKNLSNLGLSYMAFGAILVLFAGFADSVCGLASGGLFLLVGLVLRAIAWESVQDSSIQDWEYFNESN